MKIKIPKNERSIRIREAARFLGLKAETLRKYVNADLIPHHVVRSNKYTCLYFYPSELNAYLSSTYRGPKFLSNH